jgi:hypothetical protein
MITPSNVQLSQYLRTRAAEIERDARIYAKSYAVSLECARKDVSDAFADSYIGALDEAPYA